MIVSRRDKLINVLARNALLKSEFLGFLIIRIIL
jgi:hypothetical protein